jgi:hypothetical protein
MEHKNVKEEGEVIVEEESPEVHRNIVLSDLNPPTRGETLSLAFFSFKMRGEPSDFCYEKPAVHTSSKMKERKSICLTGLSLHDPA